mgnify:CR=1 FL=1
MSLKSDLAEAKKAQNKLATYCAGLPKGCNETPTYVKLNRKADAAIKKLPVSMRSLVIIDLFG